MDIQDKKIDLQEVLNTRSNILVAEGAMGTMLLSLGADVSTGSLLLNLSSPDIVRQVHSMYATAGATCVTTNSFAVCTSDDPKEIKRVQESIAASVELARQANPDAVLLADMGPSGLVLEPLGNTSFERSYSLYRRHVRALLSASEPPDAIILETFIDVADLRCAMLAVRAECDLPMIVSCTFNLGGRMPLSSTPPDIAAVVATALGASVIGSNCGLGPNETRDIIRQMSEATDLPLIVQANAGLPIAQPDGSAIYPGTAEEMAAITDEMIDLGALILGSCCGSTPEFTSAIAKAVKSRNTERLNEQLNEQSFEQTQAVDHPRKRLVAATSMSSMLLLDSNGYFDLDTPSAETLECTAADFDIWDVLELVNSCPLILIPDTQASALEAVSVLEQALRVYPGVTLVNVSDCSEDLRQQITDLCKTYGALMVNAEGKLQDGASSH